MNAVPMTFPQKWHNTFSEDAEKNHAAQRDLCNIAWLAIGATTVAVIILSAVLFQQTGLFVASLVISLIWDRIIEGPAKEFYNEAQNQQHLLDRSFEIRSLYEVKRAEGANCPKGAALRDYWQGVAQKEYETFARIRNTPCNTSLQSKAILAAEKTAAVKKVEYIFWKTLSENNEQFERVFLFPKTDLTKKTDELGSISEVATWDTRDEDKRLTDRNRRPLVRDVLLRFHDRNIADLYYNSIFNDWAEERIEGCFIQALRNIQPADEEPIPAQTKTFIQMAADSIVAYYQ
jgi:hypothetical protein